MAMVFLVIAVLMIIGLSYYVWWKTNREAVIVVNSDWSGEKTQRKTGSAHDDEDVEIH